MSDAYDLRSNIKDKPGSQGTLFQVKDKGLLNPQQRWPRGYTPERQAEVQDALKGTTIMSRQAHAVPLNPPEFDGNDDLRFARYPQAEHRVVDTLARSTVPARDIKGLRRIHDQPAQGHLATYWPDKREMAVPMFGRNVLSTGRTQQQEGEHSMIHEMGHHVDNVHTSETYSRMPQGASAPDGATWDKVHAGISEGVADNYYVKHYRGRGRSREQATQGHYESNFDPQTLDNKYPGYTSVRPAKEFSSLNGVQFQDTLF